MKVNANTQKFNTKSLIAGFSGNILEWYDFTVYGFFATVIGSQFFPHQDKVTQLIATFGIFAAGYLMRPLGGVIFGNIGDRNGRKTALKASVILMAIPTTLIAFLPTYDSIGWYAALMLVVLRLLQGLSVGGEFTGSISFLVEEAPDGKRGFFGSWSTFGVFGGILLGSAIASMVTSLLTKAHLHDWGWRLPFLLGAVIGVVGLFLRKDIDEDKPESALEKGKIPLAEFWQNYKMKAFKIIIISWAFGVSVYLLFIYLPAYLHTFHNVPLNEALSAHTLSIAVMMLLIPLFGLLNDKVGRKTVLFASLIGFVVFTYPLFSVMFRNTYQAIAISMVAFAVLEAMFQSVIPALMTEMFPKRIRYTGLSVSYNLSMAIFGGTTPMISTWLVKVSGGNVWMPAWYLIVVCIIAIVVTMFIPETFKNKLD
jgi:MHS family proline/betaine transporter-like MFS transporter